MDVLDDTDPLIELAIAIADGAPIDWSAAASAARTPSDTDALRNLRVIAEIADLHQRLQPSPHASVLDELKETRPADDARDRLPAWGPLRLMARVGEGAYGEVYRAWDSRLDRDVALKLLRRRESQRAAGTSLIEEGRLLAKIRHPNVITVYGAERIGDHVGIWMEFVEGSTLSGIVTARGPRPLSDVVRIGRDLASALQAVHDAGLLHRDIKAQNVMEDPAGRVVLMDFGAGRERGDARGIAGTPLYLAPELLSGARATVQSDVYGLGVLLYHLASGAFPVAGRSLDEIRAIHAAGGALPLRALRPDCSAALLDVVDRATAPDPGMRFATAADLERALAACIDPITTAGGRRPFVTAGVTAAATLVIAAAIGVPLMRNREAAADLGGSSSAAVARRISADAGIDGLSSLSSDGRRVAYSDPESGNLALLDVTTGRRQALTGKTAAELRDFAEASAFSPDDTTIAYAWWIQERRRYDIRTVAAAGGQPAILYGSPDIAFVSSIDWLPDGRAIVASLRTQASTVRIVVIPLPVGDARVIREYPGRPPAKLAVSPDGRFVAYDVPGRDGLARDIRLVSTDGRDDVALIDHPADDSVVDWTPDGDRLLFTTDRTTGNPSLWSITVSNGTTRVMPKMVRPDIGRSWPFRITADGSYFYGTPIQMEDVHVGTLDADMRRVDAAPATIATSFVGANRWPEWSRDGRQLAYVSRRRAGGRRSEVTVVIQSTAGATRAIAVPFDDLLRIRWSPDGRSMLGIARDQQGRGGIYRIDTTTGASTALLQESAGLPRQVDWSPDQRSIFYSSPATTAGLMRFDLQTKRNVPIYAGMYSFAVSPDGRWVVGNVDDDAMQVARLLLVSLSDGSVRELARHNELGAFTLGCAWTGDSRRMLCLKASGSTFELWRHSIDRQPPVLITSASDMRHIRLHPDGRQFAFVAGSFKAELWAMENLF